MGRRFNRRRNFRREDIVHKIRENEIQDIEKTNNFKNIEKELKDIPKIELKSGEIHETLDIYDFIEQLWIPKISILKNNKLIVNSNTFIEQDVREFQEYGENTDLSKTIPHKIYSRIIKNYNKLKIDTKNIVIEDKCIFLHNSFSTGNVGHNLFCIFNILQNYKDNINIKYILFDEIEENDMCSNIIKLFVPYRNIIKIKRDTIYNFKNQIIDYERPFHRVENYTTIINCTLDKIKINNDLLLTPEYKKKLKNRKIILIKNTEQKNMVRVEDRFDAKLLFNHLIEQDWLVINPEELNFFELSYILMNAKLIVTAPGRGISCCNQIFFNLNAKIIGFLHDPHRKDLYLLNIKENKILDGKYDAMCNGYYYNKMEQLILSPINISYENVNEFKSLNL